MSFAARVALIALVPAAVAAAAPEPPQAIQRMMTAPIQFDLSPPLASIVPVPVVPGAFREIPERGTGNEGRLGPRDVDPVVQTRVIGPATEIPSPSVSFNGPPNISNVSPPDPVGDVGPNNYIAMSNNSFQIFNKAGGSLFGPAANNTLWSGFGGACQTENAGDGVVVHDQFADRWLLMQFTAAGPTYFVCVAISATADPLGPYIRYAIPTGTNFPDYPKVGVGDTAYYFSTREFAGGATFVGMGVYALNRAQANAGAPTPQVISLLVPPGSTPYNIGDGILPMDIDGPNLPPAGRPHYYAGTMDNGGPYGAPQDALTLWKFNANFASPASSTFTLANTIPVSAFNSMFPCTPTSRACIPQSGTSNKLDILSYRQRPMYRLAYRNFGTHESLVTNQSVDAASGVAGIRWYEVRSPFSSPVVHQQGTYAPGTSDGIHRWMASIAMDGDGNMALGYSASNASMFPSVWYTGRLAGDALGTMPQGEAAIVNGTGSQTGSNRWGDYTSMNVDPVDDCTFWYVNQWVPSTSSIGWRLRIGAFKFPSCAPPVSGKRKIDFNADGKSDLSWKNTSSGASALWLMNGTGTLSTGIVLSDPNWSVTHTGDFSGDGKTDLVWRSAVGSTAVWLQNGLATTSAGTILTDPNWLVLRVGDLNGDGKGDLVWRNNATGQIAAWLMNGVSATSSVVLLGDPNWVVTHTGDFNGDGKADLVWRNESTGATAVWLMNGLTALSSAVLFTSLTWAVTQVGDFNGDGKDDLVWRDTSTGATAIWLMNGTTPTSSTTIFTSLPWVATLVGDFNGDGKDDLVWRNASTGQTAIWLMNGAAPTSQAVVFADPNWAVTHVADANGDGKSDLVWRNSASGATAVWLMNGTAATSTATILADPTWVVSPPNGM